MLVQINKVLIFQLIVLNLMNTIQLGMQQEYRQSLLILNVVSLGLSLTILILDYLKFQSNNLGLLTLCYINTEILAFSDLTYSSYYSVPLIMKLVTIPYTKLSFQYRLICHIYLIYFAARVIFLDSETQSLWIEIVTIILLQPGYHFILNRSNRTQQNTVSTQTATQQSRQTTIITHIPNFIDDYQELIPSSKREIVHVITEDMDKRIITKKVPCHQYKQEEISQLSTPLKQEDDENTNRAGLYGILNCLPFGVLFIDKDIQQLYHNRRMETFLAVSEGQEVLEKLNQYISTAEIVEVCDYNSRKSKIFEKARSCSIIRKATQDKPSKKFLQTQSFTNVKLIINKISNSQKSLCPDQSSVYIIRVKDDEDETKIIRILKMRVFRLQNNSFWQDNVYLFVFENIKKKEEAKLLNDKVNFQQRLLNSLCHELRTPMNATLCQLTALSDKIPQNLQKVYLTPAMISAKRLYYFMNDIMDYAQILCNNFKLNFSNFKTIDIKDTIFNLFEHDCTQKQIQLSVIGQFDNNISSDKERILRILINLIDNSIKFTNTGGHIVISFQQDDKVLSFEVEDNGTGISNEKLAIIQQFHETIYSDFYDQSKLGLGLRLSQQIAKYLCIDNHLMIESQEGKFTKIKFKILNNFDCIEALSSSRLMLPKKKCSCIPILIVDDISCNHYALQILLRRYSINTDSAYDGEMAIKKVLAKLSSKCCSTYRLIFMDIEMPIKNGYIATKEIVQILKQNGLIGHCMIAMYSAYSGEEDIRIAKACGMKEIVKKPLEPAVLDYVISKYIF